MSENILKGAFKHNCIELHKVNMSHSYLQKYICYKNDIKSLNFSCTGSYKRLWIHFVQYLEMSEKNILS